MKLFGAAVSRQFFAEYLFQSCIIFMAWYCLSVKLLPSALTRSEVPWEHQQGLHTRNVDFKRGAASAFAPECKVDGWEGVGFSLSVSLCIYHTQDFALRIFSLFSFHFHGTAVVNLPPPPLQMNSLNSSSVILSYCFFHLFREFKLCKHWWAHKNCVTTYRHFR